MYAGYPSFDIGSKYGLWFGIALDTPNGKNNGTIAGERYFKCKPGASLSQPLRARSCFRPPCKALSTLGSEYANVHRTYAAPWIALTFWCLWPDHGMFAPAYLKKVTLEDEDSDEESSSSSSSSDEESDIEGHTEIRNGKSRVNSFLV